MTCKTPLYALHLDLGGRMVEFAGWSLPVHYGSQVEEHLAVRRAAGMFDVSHMMITDVEGPDAAALLSWLLANETGRLRTPGQGLYSCLLNERGGVVDDTVVYARDAQRFRMVSNASTRDKVLSWVEGHAAGRAARVAERRDLAMIAVQGPAARERCYPLLPAALAEAARGLKPYTACFTADRCVARTGYTGEDGFEIMVPAGDAVGLWAGLYESGVSAVGLGARDSLRLEAGMNLYGADMDENISPLECGLAGTVAMGPDGRRFVGRAALEERIRAGVRVARIGLVLAEGGVLRAHQRVEADGAATGRVTSGGYSPVLRKSIGLARIPVGAARTLRVEVRGKWLPAQAVRPPFVRHGQCAMPHSGNGDLR
ncbi:MAG: glycine cleavage system aminomethyltransferase GcvT [Pseudomonadota bacterium]|nr:glycine cleavage system aminomethyltransferase GcvT [Pseudomonadota bacterium]